MPMTYKTVKGAVSGMSGFRNTALNMAKSLAEAVGTTHGEMSVSIDEKHKDEQCYYISMDSVGYSGWFVTLNAYVDTYNYIECNICRTLEGENSPDLKDSNRIRFFLGGSSVHNGTTGRPETCVMIYDEFMDTLLIDIHHGETIHGTDLTSYSGTPFDTKFAIFFAKDVNDNVLCGVGNGYISTMRTTDSKKIFATTESDFGDPQRLSGLTNTLHLTKMVNYLDPSYPEMKSAYVSLIRPITDTTKEKRVSLYESNGSKIGTVGNTDWAQENHTDNYGVLYQPIHPFVKY